MLNGYSDLDCSKINIQDYFLKLIPKMLKKCIKDIYSDESYDYASIPTYFVKDYFNKHPEDLKGYKLDDFISQHNCLYDGPRIKEVDDILYKLYPTLSDNYVDFLDEMMDHFEKTKPSYYTNPYEKEHKKTFFKLQLANETGNLWEELCETQISKDYDNFLYEMEETIYKEKCMAIDMFSIFLKEVVYD